MAIEMAPAAEAPGNGVRAVLNRLDSLTGRREVALRDVVEAFGDAAYVPLLLVPALLVISPLSGIPLVPTVLGLTMALISVQSMFGKRHLWLPEVLMRRKVPGSRLHRGIEWVRGTADWLDRHSVERLPMLVRPPLDLLPKALCGLSGAAMPFLELVPFSSSVLALAIALFAISLLVADGLYVLLGGVAMAVGLAIPVVVYGGLFALST